MIGKMMRAALISFAFAFIVLPCAAHAAMMEGEAPPSAPPKDAKVETECPAGTFKYEGTCWVQGDCPEGQAVYKPGVCLPIPKWKFAPPEEAEEPAAVPAPAEKPKQP